MDKELIAFCALNNILGFEPRIGLALIENLGSARAVFEMDPAELCAVLGPSSKYKFRFNGKALEEAEKELEDLGRYGACFIPLSAPDYPALLKECPDPPLGIYVRSNSPMGTVFDPSRPRVAIVGTRDLSPYGRYWTEEIVAALGKCRTKPVIVSGLALGTDVKAHSAALEEGLPTIGVMATGVDRVYPAVHWEIAGKIAASEGSALLSDYPLGTSPIAINFIRRNRIIAGLCENLIVIESKTKGGSLLSARYAVEYSRSVFALPGRIDDIMSQGCNSLLRAKMAEPINDLGELIGDMGLGSWVFKRVDQLEAALEESFSKDERFAVIKAVALEVKKNRGLTPEEISRNSGIGYKDVCYSTGVLENEGFIESDLFGRCWIKRK